MIITVNIVQLSTELAHEFAMTDLTRAGFDDEAIMEPSDDGEGTQYTEFAQGYFDKWYDHFYDIVLKSKI